jgi:hypothetical protein
VHADLATPPLTLPCCKWCHSLDCCTPVTGAAEKAALATSAALAGVGNGPRTGQEIPKPHVATGDNVDVVCTRKAGPEAVAFLMQPHGCVLDRCWACWGVKAVAPGTLLSTSCVAVGKVVAYDSCPKSSQRSQNCSFGGMHVSCIDGRAETGRSGLGPMHCTCSAELPHARHMRDIPATGAHGHL